MEYFSFLKKTRFSFSVQTQDYVTFIERFVYFKFMSHEPMSLFSSWHA